VLDESVEARLRDECLDDGLLFPDYERYCFAGVPGTVGEVLGADVGTSLPEDVLAGVDTDVENVVCVLVDGLGYDCWVRDRREHGFLDRVTEEGTVTPLTSIYHAETAAAITTVHTGDTAAEHGLLGWDVYLDEPGFVLETLPFRQKGGTAGDAAELVDPDVLYGGETVYERLAEAEIDAHAFQPAATIDTPYSRRTLAGSEGHPYENVAGMAVSLRRTLERAKNRTYCYAYVPNIDAVSHDYGTDSEEYGAQLAMIAGRLERELSDRLDRETAEWTLLLVTADHGHIDTTPATNIDILSHDVVREGLRQDERGEPIPPVGGPRNVHLHLRPERVDRVQEYLEETFDARVFTREEAFSIGLFGAAEPAERTRERCGDLLFTHRERTTWYDDGESIPDLLGQHGGLSSQEMLVPFGAVGLSALQTGSDRN
jgi:hypothetical protein